MITTLLMYYVYKVNKDHSNFALDINTLLAAMAVDLLLFIAVGVWLN